MSNINNHLSKDASTIIYDNSISSLSDTNIKSAIDSCSSLIDKNVTDIADIQASLSSLSHLDDGRSKSLGKVNNFSKIYSSEFASHGNVDFTVNSTQGYLDFWNYDSTNFVRLMIKRSAIWFGPEVKDSSTNPKINLGDYGYSWGNVHGDYYHGSGEYLDLETNRATIRSISPYDATITYKENDYVSYNGELFFANTDSPNNEPDTSVDWSPAFSSNGSGFDLWDELENNAFRKQIGNVANPLYNIFSDSATVGEIACPRSLLTIKNNFTDTSLSIENSTGFVAIKPNPSFQTGIGTLTNTFQYAFIDEQMSKKISTNILQPDLRTSQHLDIYLGGDSATNVDNKLSFRFDGVVGTGGAGIFRPYLNNQSDLGNSVSRFENAYINNVINTRSLTFVNDLPDLEEVDLNIFETDYKSLYIEDHQGYNNDGQKVSAGQVINKDRLILNTMFSLLKRIKDLEARSS